MTTYNAIRKTNTGDWIAAEITEKNGEIVRQKVIDQGNKRQAIKAAGTNRVID